MDERRWIGSKIDGSVCGVPVYGVWTGRGVKVLAILDGKPLDIAQSSFKGTVEGRFVGRKEWIEIGGEYRLDE